MSEEQDIDSVPQAGGWLILGGWLLAVGWLGAAAALVWAYVGVQGVLALPVPVQVAGVSLALLPVIIVLVSAYTARQNSQMAAANAIVLRAAQRLLRPAGESAGEARAIADAARGDAARLLQLMQETNRQVASLRAGLNEEAKALTGVTERARSAASELVDRMTRERNAMTELAGSLEAQIKAFTEIIPDMARQMRESAQMANADIAASDAALGTRMKAFDISAKTMIDQAARLDAIAGDTLIHADRLTSSLQGIEQQMLASRRTVETAVRAGELAATAASATGDALRDAVGHALDGARHAAEAIKMQAHLSQREAEAAIDRLKEAAAQAQVTSQAASAAAQAQAEDTERHITRLTQALFQASTRVESFAAAQATIAEQRLAHTGQPIPASAPNRASANGAAPEAPTIRPAPQIMPAPQSPPQATLPPVAGSQGPVHGYEVLPHVPSEQLAAPPVPDVPPPPKIVLPHAEPRETFEDFFSALSDKEFVSPANAAMPPVDTEADSFRDVFFDPDSSGGEKNGSSLSWRELLANIDEEVGAPGLTRALVLRLERSGVRLTDLLDVRDIRKVSQASRRSDRERRRAMRDVAGRTVDQAAKALVRDEALQRDASAFIRREEEECLRQLDEAERRREGADARLAAFLVLDAALA
jgi:hypothetical protein